MKPQTLETTTNLTIEDIQGEMKELITAICSATDSSDLRDCATNCRNIADDAEALCDILLTAADEIDRIENEIIDGIAPETLVGISEETENAEAAGVSFIDSDGNVQVMTQEEHDEAHRIPHWGELDG